MATPDEYRAAGDRQDRTKRRYPRSDARIRDDIAERLYYSSHLDAGEVSVEVRDGVATLEGETRSRSMKHDIEDLVAETPGVKDVENRIRVAAHGRAAASEALEGSPAGARRGDATPDLEPPAGGLHTARHQEWLLDEGVQESFPASDTPSSVQPGSLAARKT